MGAKKSRIPLDRVGQSGIEADDQRTVAPTPLAKRRRAWILVDTMNRCFREPLVEAAKGGTGGAAPS